MAQLRSYFSLCPLVDRKNFIGISEDKESGCGIVTWGKNVITRYKFSDQKQLGGWTSKDHISSPVVYDVDKKQYVGIFNERIVKTWEVNTQNLDGLKKHKFSQPVLKIIKNTLGGSVIIFKDGGCADLSYGILARRNLESVDILQNNEVLMECAIYNYNEKLHICYILKNESNGCFCILTSELNADINTLTLDTLRRVEIKREEFIKGKVVGVAVSSAAEPPQVHILWSDCRLFSYNLIEESFTLVGHVGRISCEVEVSMAWMGDNHIALYGADSAHEGAVLAVYNVLFGVGSCSHPLKMFCRGARLWCLRENILLEAAQHLAVVPYTLSSDRSTLSLICSQKSDNDNETVLMADWGSGKVNWKPKETWADLAKQGISEREICKEYLPQLLDEDFGEIINMLKSFKDIPENMVVTLIAHALKHVENKDFVNCPDNDFAAKCTKEKKWRALLNLLFGLPYIKENLIPYYRKHFLYADSLLLLRYLNYLLEDKNGDNVFDWLYEEKLLAWSTVIIDAHYQQIVLAKDDRTIEIISHLNATINDLICQVDEVENVVPLLESICSGKNNNKTMNFNENSSYYVEEVKLNYF